MVYFYISILLQMLLLRISQFHSFKVNVIRNTRPSLFSSNTQRLFSSTSTVPSELPMINYDEINEGDAKIQFADYNIIASQNAINRVYQETKTLGTSVSDAKIGDFVWIRGTIITNYYVYSINVHSLKHLETYIYI